MPSTKRSRKRCWPLALRHTNGALTAVCCGGAPGNGAASLNRRVEAAGARGPASACSMLHLGILGYTALVHVLTHVRHAHSRGRPFYIFKIYIRVVLLYEYLVTRQSIHNAVTGWQYSKYTRVCSTKWSLHHRYLYLLAFAKMPAATST